MDSRRLMFVVLVALLVFGLALSLIAAWRSGDWWGFALNLGTELVGAVVVYILFDYFIEGRKGTEAEKERLIEEMGSRIRDVAVAAAEKLRLHGWLADGSLNKAKLSDADLSGAYLFGANLCEANLTDANLTMSKLIGADLTMAGLWGAKLLGTNLRAANLSGAYLREANLSGAKLLEANLTGAMLLEANLQEAKLDETTMLPDGTMWTPDTDIERFSHPDHPDFWRSDDFHSPAYRGKDGD